MVAEKARGIVRQAHILAGLDATLVSGGLLPFGEARSDAPDALGPQTQTAVHLRLSVEIVPVNDLGQMANEVIE